MGWPHLGDLPTKLTNHEVGWSFKVYPINFMEVSPTWGYCSRSTSLSGLPLRHAERILALDCDMWLRRGPFLFIETLSLVTWAADWALCPLVENWAVRSCICILVVTVPNTLPLCARCIGSGAYTLRGLATCCWLTSLLKPLPVSSSSGALAERHPWPPFCVRAFSFSFSLCSTSWRRSGDWTDPGDQPFLWSLHFAAMATRSDDSTVPSWDGQAKNWRRYTKEVAWFVASTPTKKRRYVASKLISRLSGPCASSSYFMVQNWIWFTWWNLEPVEEASWLSSGSQDPSEYSCNSSTIFGI